MSNNRRAGIIFVKVDGVQHDAKGAFTYSLGIPKASAILGSDGPQGYKEEPQIPFIEGKFTDKSTVDLAALQRVRNATVTLELANGKVIVLREAWYASEGNVNTEEAEVDVRYEGMSADEIPA